MRAGALHPGRMQTGQLDAVITTSSHLARHPQILRWNTPMIVLHESWELPPAADIVLPFPVRLAELHDALIRATERDEAEDATHPPRLFGIEESCTQCGRNPCETRGQ